MSPLEIKFGMLADKLNGQPVFYFAGYKRHSEFYTTPGGGGTFCKRTVRLQTGGMVVQFSLDEQLSFERGEVVGQKTTIVFTPSVT